jgi:hypothetical protein
MPLNIKALAIASAIGLGACFLLVGLANLIWESYGVAFLQLGASVYPGYDGPGGIWSVIVVTLYAIVDGVVCGAIFGWLYNWARGLGGAPAPTTQPTETA